MDRLERLQRRKIGLEKELLREEKKNPSKARAIEKEIKVTTEEINNLIYIKNVKKTETTSGGLFPGITGFAAVIFGLFVLALLFLKIKLSTNYVIAGLMVAILIATLIFRYMFKRDVKKIGQY
ncbi:MAG: hypothetical protein AABW88_03595 [Nanoarchaeota archaeon]